MKATLISRTRIVIATDRFAEMVLWRLPVAMQGSAYHFKYRLAFVVRGKCVLRYDNESGKGDHRHWRGKQYDYAFSTPEQLVADFQHDIARWNDEDRRS
ncbi:toxin-antitoxin system TumE family protein [Rugamonas apoptosis]|uniref:Uncharacterized protein n=1 Tax=Rugamonas apoptosis TaxID=2758570 RepID=A0A7W2IJR1_9BURK|nr:DUF6516 family protein [Rugamonas apoptosis]MBA5686779.1 hypothetical protein [Rugamonas apoptosis]